MNKNFLTEVFGEQEGFVYEYIGTIPEGINPESVEMIEHVTVDFLNGIGDNMVSTRVVQFPYQDNKIMLYVKSATDLNTSDEFVLMAHLVPDVVIQPAPIEPVVEETTPETTPEETQETPGEGQ